MRDQQRQKLYDAERRAEEKLRKLHRDHSGPHARPVDVGLSRIQDGDCQRYVHDVCDHVGVKRVRVRLVPADGHAARYDREDDDSPAEVVLPPWARNKVTILHELAHHLTHRYFPGHGPEFVQNFLMLLRTFLPSTVVQIFEDEFLAGGVEVKPGAKSSGRQGIRFLVYALKLKKRGDSKRVVVITSEPKRYVGYVIDFDRNASLKLGRCASHTKPLHEIDASDVRYATWWSGDA